MSDEKNDGAPAKKIAESIGESLLKEMTVALVHQMKATNALTAAILGTDGEGEDDPGDTGLLEALATVQESLDGVDARLTGLAVKLSGVEFVLDGLAAIAQGDLDATPPIVPRVPHWEDAANLKRDFDRKLEEEQATADEAERTALEEATQEVPAPEPAAPPPAKPSMIANAVPRKPLPSLPVVAPD